MDLKFLDPAIERKKRLENAEKILKEKIEDIKKIIPNCKVFLFGSYVEGNFDVLSDVDVAIVSNNVNEKIRIEVQKILGSPFEIHIFTEEEWKEFKKYIKFKEII